MVRGLTVGEIQRSLHLVLKGAPEVRFEDFQILALRIQTLEPCVSLKCLELRPMHDLNYVTMYVCSVQIRIQ